MNEACRNVDCPRYSPEASESCPRCNAVDGAMERLAAEDDPYTLNGALRNTFGDVLDNLTSREMEALRADVRDMVDNDEECIAEGEGLYYVAARILRRRIGSADVLPIYSARAANYMDIAREAKDRNDLATLLWAVRRARYCNRQFILWRAYGNSTR